MELSSFLDDVAHIAEDVGHAAEKVAKVATPETPEVAEVTLEAAAAGGIVVDGVFSKQHTELLKSIDKECSVDQLIDLRSSLIKANRMLK